MFSRKDILDLAEAHGSNVVSIYLPTHSKGAEVLQREDQRNFKNQIRIVKEYLSQRGLTSNEIIEFLLPLEDLAQDVDFWNNQSEGLAVFLANGIRQEYRLPISIEARTYVSTGFLVWPLLPLIENDSDYHLLTLSLRQVVLYRASRFEIKKIRSTELDNISFETVVGSDYEQKNLQLRSHHAAQAQATYHGQGEGHEDQDQEINKYFRAVRQVLDALTQDNHLPLVLAGLDHHISAFRAVYVQPNVVPDYVHGNPRDKELGELHRESWDIVKSTLEKNRMSKLGKLRERVGTAKTELDLTRIFPAGFQGKIDTLFLRRGFEAWGIYDPVKEVVRHDNQHHGSNVSLINLISVEILRKGSDVFILEKEEMPDESIDICALYRY